MENLLREILAPSPVPAPATLPAGPLPLPVASPSASEGPAAPAAQAPTPSAETLSSAMAVDWEGQVEMQRLLGMLSGAQPDAEAFPSALDLDVDLDFGEWDMGGAATQEVGVC